jgi:hypothetical protein
MSLTKISSEKNVETFRAFINCKSLEEFSGVQEMAKKGYDEWVNGAAEISGQYVKVTSDALQPLGDQLNKTVKNFSDGTAA